MPSCPGARSTWATALGERTVKVGPPPLVAGSDVPSQKWTANGRSGSVRSISLRRAEVRAKAIAASLSTRPRPRLLVLPWICGLDTGPTRVNGTGRGRRRILESATYPYGTSDPEVQDTTPNPELQP